MKDPEVVEVRIIEVEVRQARGSRLSKSNIRCWNCGGHDLKEVVHCRPIYAPKTNTYVCRDCSKITEVLIEEDCKNISTRSERSVSKGGVVDCSRKRALHQVCLASA